MDPEFYFRRNPHERRRRALAKLDEAPFSRAHIHTVIIAGLGLFTSAYEIFAINLAVTMLGIVYWQGEDSGSGKVPFIIEAAIKVATLAGAMIGHPLFGWLADRYWPQTHVRLWTGGHDFHYSGSSRILFLSFPYYEWSFDLLASGHGCWNWWQLSCYFCDYFRVSLLVSISTKRQQLT